ncbi:alpha-hydroxy acid oxidase [Azospirillum rugosum]|uniref:L-lactate dehydrogenase (Cytochrome) n=1 Tax=Azospirillum rugosum TaxID=416170 RepID=A0ABS4SN97_9PROT|nr:alpha-hydroxy acid oxidase [Azospirillum rugosum]MBP2293704.1 L-lactate dehydrogenase (cytochrome) [Azospirillum rugosum]MDQ0527249.1 L-lactate dehydrogenase (cytochrome) [Azospirillum rugosum]
MRLGAHSILNVAEARDRARSRLPRGLFEYIERGTEDEVGLIEAKRSLDSVTFNPRVLVDISNRDATTSIFGTRQPLPLVVAPTAIAGLIWYDGEVELAKAAAAAGIPFCVSTQSITSVERIAEESRARLWFQLYVWRNRDRAIQLVKRAERAGAEALVLTVDTAVAPNREYNIRNGFGIPIKPSLRAGLDCVAHPRWFVTVFAKYLRNGGVPTYAHYPDEFRTALGRVAVADEISLAQDVSWEDVRTLRSAWKGQLILKGVLRADDAVRAAELGVDGIVVSNHGARNLDGAATPATCLPEIVDRVGHRLTVLADGGVRRGSHVAKYIGMGAQGVLLGRSVLYGLAIGGAEGAGAVLDIFRRELLTTMGFLGAPSIPDIVGTVVPARG